MMKLNTNKETPVIKSQSPPPHLKAPLIHHHQPPKHHKSHTQTARTSPLTTIVSTHAGTPNLRVTSPTTRPCKPKPPITFASLNTNVIFSTPTVLAAHRYRAKDSQPCGQSVSPYSAGKPLRSDVRPVNLLNNLIVLLCKLSKSFSLWWSHPPRSYTCAGFPTGVSSQACAASVRLSAGRHG